MSEIRQRGDRCWRGRDRWGSKGGQLDVRNLMRAENWKEDRRGIIVEEREEGERGDGITVERKQMEDKNKMVGCRRRRKQRAVFKTEMGVDMGLKSVIIICRSLFTGAFSDIRANFMGCRLEGMSSIVPCC